jgi:hypothetical protein
LWFESSYNQRTPDAVRTLTERQPAARIFADVRYSDWLLWRDQSLAGRIAFDARLELLSQPLVVAIADLGPMVALGQLDVLKGYRVFVLARSSPYTRALIRRSGTRVVSRNSDAVVALASDSMTPRRHRRSSAA